MSELSEKKCVACTEETEPLKGVQLLDLFRELEEGWELLEDAKLIKTYKFKDFKEAFSFVNDVGKIAEEEGHHPDLFLTWGKVQVTFFTHKIKGLSESDFIMAAKCDVVYLSKVR